MHDGWYGARILIVDARILAVLVVPRSLARAPATVYRRGWRLGTCGRICMRRTGDAACNGCAGSLVRPLQANPTLIRVDLHLPSQRGDELLVHSMHRRGGDAQPPHIHDQRPALYPSRRPGKPSPLPRHDDLQRPQVASDLQALSVRVFAAREDDERRVTLRKDLGRMRPRCSDVRAAAEFPFEWRVRCKYAAPAADTDAGRLAARLAPPDIDPEAAVGRAVCFQAVSNDRPGVTRQNISRLTAVVWDELTAVPSAFRRCARGRCLHHAHERRAQLLVLVDDSDAVFQHSSLDLVGDGNLAALEGRVVGTHEPSEER
mmetsp:Transcript_16816/g.58819  ORF Transcript_16816/g.58819 Transcript_16816/m.58819 type:complete len:317 (+) Transcript_16816:1632-2582(+)